MATSVTNILHRSKDQILRMKRLVIISMLVMLSASCGKHLNQYPSDGIPAEKITQDHAQMLTTGMYNIVQYKPTFNGWALFDLIGGDLIRTGATNVNTPKLMVEGAIDPNKSIVTSPWNGYFAGLYQINITLEYIEKLPDISEKNTMLGTCHFFRGLYYYHLVTRWRNLPIIRSSKGGELETQRSEAEVWEFVAEEFNKAITLLPEFTDKNYVSQEAAKGLLARTYLAMGRKEEAAALAESLILDSKFSLCEFSDIFRGSHNTEEIFTFANLLQEGRVNFSSYYYTKESGVGGGYNFCPTAEVMNMYQEYDKRKDISIGYQGSNPVLNKYCSGDAGRDPIYIVRLAEMYLISAECKGLQNGIDRLNELRLFRGLDRLNPSNEEEFIDAILNERRLELLGEGFRWFDLVRCGKYESTVGVDSKYTILPIPAREFSLNSNLRQHPLWQAKMP